MPCKSIHYAVARVKVLEDKLINRDKADRMVSAKDARGAFKVLLDMGYGGAQAKEARDFEKMIDFEADKMREFIHSITPDEELTDVFIMRYDYQNSKAFLKMRISNIDEMEAVSDAGKLDVKELKEMVYEHDIVGLPKHLADAIDEAAKELILKPSPQKIDIIIDKAYMKWALSVAKKKKNKFMLDYIMTKIDMTNIFMMLRVRYMDADYDLFRQAYIEGGRIEYELIEKAYHDSDELLSMRFKNTVYKRGLTSIIESSVREKAIWKFGKYLDNELMGIIRKYKDDIFKIEPILGYYLAKENETQAVRIIMTGKLNHMNTEVIRERLREVYA